VDDPEAEPDVSNDPVPLHPDDPQPTEDDPSADHEAPEE
jgi:hypothetical protein